MSLALVVFARAAATRDCTSGKAIDDCDARNISFLRISFPTRRSSIIAKLVGLVQQVGHGSGAALVASLQVSSYAVRTATLY